MTGISPVGRQPGPALPKVGSPGPPATALMSRRSRGAGLTLKDGLSFPAHSRGGCGPAGPRGDGSTPRFIMRQVVWESSEFQMMPLEGPDNRTGGPKATRVAGKVPQPLVPNVPRVAARQHARLRATLSPGCRVRGRALIGAGSLRA